MTILTSNVAKAPADEFVATITRTLPSALPTITAGVLYKGQGIYEISYTPALSGTYAATIDLGVTPVIPADTITISSATAAASTTIFSAPHSGGSANTPLSFQVDAYDGSGNQHLAGGHEFVVLLDDHDGNFLRGEVADLGNGGYLVSYQVPTVGDWTLTVLLANGVNGVVRYSFAIVWRVCYHFGQPLSLLRRTG
jgi:hypothetical protein